MRFLGTFPLEASGEQGIAGRPVVQNTYDKFGSYPLLGIVGMEYYSRSPLVMHFKESLIPWPDRFLHTRVSSGGYLCRGGSARLRVVRFRLTNCTRDGPEHDGILCGASVDA